uniref:DUF4216 domain-containing protein n=1 Tax=Lactuca sativa TaxID=4236 RepID=A0A9R1V2S6_LACSA|nr:hypothetical protein LSAT_V11C700374100 [Lactuca sativa]
MNSIGNPHERVDERIRSGKPLSKATIDVVGKRLANREDICDDVRWLAKGPNFAVSKYSGFAINEYHFHTTSRDESRTTQCNGVSLVTHVMQIASPKDSNPVYSVVTYFGRINEIWDLDYRMFNILVFMCDWVDSRGVKKDDLGFMLVNFDRLGQKSEPFVLASQVKQVFYVQDQEDENLHVVGFTPHRLCFCDMESDSASDHDEDSKQRGPTTKAKANKEKLVVTYNKKGVTVGKEATKLSTFDGLVARTMVLITYESWLEVSVEVKEGFWQYVLFVVDPKSWKQTLQSIGKKWRNFKHYLHAKFIKNRSKDPKENLFKPPKDYPFIKKEEKSMKAKNTRAHHKYNHCLSRKGYAGLINDIV